MPLLYLHQPFPGNGFYQWKFFSCTRSGPVFRDTRAELKPLSTELITPTVGTDNIENTVLLLLPSCPLSQEIVYRTVAQKWVA
jgi:hypothetical protein